QKYPELLKADGTIWEGATLTPENEQTQTFTTVVDLICGLKGNAYYDIMTTGPPKLPRTDVHSGQAAATPNAAWRIIWALSTLKNDKEEILIDGFNELVADPSPEDIEVLKLGGTEFEEGFKKDYGLDRILLDRSGLELGIELALKPSLTICGIKGGFTDKGSKTIVPSYTSAKLDFRLVPNLTMEKVTELLQAHLTKHGFDDIRFELIGGYDPGKTPINHPFIKMLEKISTAITTPKKTAITPIAAGSGPAYLFTEYTPICFVGNYIGGLNGHAPNENIPLTTIRSSIAYNAIIGEELSKL
ncbi:MAG: peptidase dimerization domain-containing protein, partial [Candidatus Thorarchaeota archaeon]